MLWNTSERGGSLLTPQLAQRPHWLALIGTGTALRTIAEAPRVERCPCSYLSALQTLCKGFTYFVPCRVSVILNFRGKVYSPTTSHRARVCRAQLASAM